MIQKGSIKKAKAKEEVMSDTDMKSMKPKASKLELFRIKVEFNDSTTAYNRNISVDLESSTEDVKTLLNYAHDFVEEQRRGKKE
mgnify:CR=1 FL=1